MLFWFRLDELTVYSVKSDSLSPCRSLFHMTEFDACVGVKMFPYNLVFCDLKINVAPFFSKWIILANVCMNISVCI